MTGLYLLHESDVYRSVKLRTMDYKNAFDKRAERMSWLVNLPAPHNSSAPIKKVYKRLGSPWNKFQAWLRQFAHLSPKFYRRVKKAKLWPRFSTLVDFTALWFRTIATDLKPNRCSEAAVSDTGCSPYSDKIGLWATTLLSWEPCREKKRENWLNHQYLSLALADYADILTGWCIMGPAPGTAESTSGQM